MHSSLELRTTPHKALQAPPNLGALLQHKHVKPSTLQQNTARQPAKARTYDDNPLSHNYLYFNFSISQL